MKVIEVEGLCKDYRQHFWTPLRRVLHSVSFHVNQGEIFGFLGPNGSGKSTTIKILFQLIFPSAGQARLFEKPIGDLSVRRRIGYLPEISYYYDYLTAHEFLEFHGRLGGLDDLRLKKRIPEVLERVGMRGTGSLFLRSFSKGMLQRIGLAQAIIHDPDLVVLDEPMTGLDPLGRKEVRDLMLSLRDQGKTVFFSTHILSDVETICDRVAILNKGRLLSCGSLGELVNIHAQSVDIVWKKGDLLELCQRLDASARASAEGIYVRVMKKPDESFEDFQKRVNEHIAEGQRRGGLLEALNPKKESLEDVFVRQVGHLEERV